jgi:hypothetical protein
MTCQHGSSFLARQFVTPVPENEFELREPFIGVSLSNRRDGIGKLTAVFVCTPLPESDRWLDWFVIFRCVLSA